MRRLANAKTEFDRYARLVKSSAVSRAEYELAETAYRVAQEDRNGSPPTWSRRDPAPARKISTPRQAEVRALEARLAEANLQLADSTLRAPYDGVVAQRFVDEKQTIVANKPVVTFQNVDEIDVVADVPEAAHCCRHSLAGRHEDGCGVQHSAWARSSRYASKRSPKSRTRRHRHFKSASR